MESMDSGIGLTVRELRLLSQAAKTCAAAFRTNPDGKMEKIAEELEKAFSKIDALLLMGQLMDMPNQTVN